MARRPPTASRRSRIRWGDDQPIDADDARGRILVAAIARIDRAGAAKLTVDDVAKAAAITRPTLYRYFGSRNELLVAVFLRLLDESLDRGLHDFFREAETLDDLRDATAESFVYLLTVIRENEAIQSILDDTRIPVDDLLTGATELLVGVMRTALQIVLTEALEPSMLGWVRAGFQPETAAEWIIRLVYAFLVCPAPGRELELARQYLAPAFLVD